MRPFLFCGAVCGDRACKALRDKDWPLRTSASKALSRSWRGCQTPSPRDRDARKTVSEGLNRPLDAAV